MLFGKRPHTVKRLLIVEDEPLVAFDNEHLLAEAGFKIVATVDRTLHAIAALEAEDIDLVLCDLRLRDGDDGIDVAKAAHERGVPVLFVSGYCPLEAQKFAIGCLAKPHRQRDLLEAIEAVEAYLKGKRKRKKPDVLTLYS
jgi:DNA-binding NtrC family response regulator